MKQKPDPTGPTVYVLHFHHRHGDDFGAYATHQAAVEAQGVLAVEFGDESGAEIGAEIRARYAQGKVVEAVELYLKHHEDEAMEIHELEVRS